jgi:SAM-dependent methyltransferase
MNSPYVCPKTMKPLSETADGLRRDDSVLYRFVSGYNHTPIPDFLVHELGELGKRSLAAYNQTVSVPIYRNFLDWLFQTFGEDEPSFRRALVTKLNLAKGSRVLVTGCGLGDDIPAVIEAAGPDGETFAQDLSSQMVIAASKLVASAGAVGRVHFSISDAACLPFADDYFDGALHFGGINLFDDIRLAVAEMNRVVKPGGRVVFGDEGVAPWLKNEEYGRIAITNNSLWKVEPPIGLLPGNAADVALSWVLGNCFYVISFAVSDEPPFMNIDVPHKGGRGGSMRTRYFGQLEGVSEDSKRFVLADAKRLGISIHDWLENAIADRRK